MSKIRVYELARELNMESKALVNKLKGIGVEVASHQSTLTPEQAEKIRGLVRGAEAPSPEPKTASAPSRVIIRRRAARTDEEEAAEAAVPSAASPVVARAPQEVEESEPVVVEPAEPVEDIAVDPLETSAPEAPVDVEEALPASPEPFVSEPIAPPSEPAVARAQQPEARPEAQSPSPEIRRRTVSSGGATIVRRASPEEIQANAAQQAARAEPRGTGPGSARRPAMPREDHRGIRATETFGGRPGMGPGGNRPAPAAAAAPSSAEGEGGFSDLRRRLETKKEKTKEEAEEEIRKANAAKLKRTGGSVNTRLLLKQLEDFSEDESAPVEEAPPAPDFGPRTVYTPSSGASRNRREVKRRKDMRKTAVTTPRAAYRIVKMGEAITVGELAHQMSVKASELIKKLMTQGVMATINNNLDVDTATLLASDFGFEVQSVVKTVDDILGVKPQGVQEAPLLPRPPIVTIMGHVDHGKTSILDAIRQSNVAQGEAGGITQHIGAYTVKHNEQTIAFLDTPGHEAFSAMRARGAGLTDIVVLVVAADDGVMPQTIEAISHAKEAQVPIVVAVNKIDKPNINLDRIYTQLAEHGVQAEEWGGDVQFVKVSALQKIGLDDLLEAILLQSEVLDLKASPTLRAEGAVVEAHLDKGRGPVATVMVKNGTLRVGDFIVAGVETGRVRAMTDHLGRRLTEALPSTPVEVIGLSGVPLAGDQVNAVEDERVSRDVVDYRLEQVRREAAGKSAAASINDLLNRVKEAERAEVALIVKADTQGSVEAIADALLKLNTPRVANRIVHRGAGGVTESDVTLAAAAKSVIIAFNVRAARGLDEVAERVGVPIKYFSIIYDLVDAVKSLMAGQLPPVVKEVVIGRAEVRQSISVPKVGTVAGSAVLDGRIQRNANLRLIRENIVIYNGRIGSLRRFKEDVREVAQGYECGIGIDGYNDIRAGDVIEAYILEESAPTL